MKICDIEKRDKMIIPYTAVIVLVMLAFMIVKRNEIDAAVLAICCGLCVLLLLISVYYAGVIRLREYFVDSEGITANLFWGKKKLHFSWEQFRSLASYTVKPNHSPAYTVLVLSTDEMDKLPKAKCIKEPGWFKQRYKSIVVFKFSMERYEYIRQFCALEYTDNRNVEFAFSK